MGDAQCVTLRDPRGSRRERFDRIDRTVRMSGMSNTTSPNLDLSLTKGAYTIDVIARRKKLPVKKNVPINGDWHNGYEERTIFLSVVSVMVVLTHRISADTITFRYRKMGSKESVTCAKTGQPPTLVRSKIATGPELIPVGGKPESTNVNKAAASIDRMSGMGWKEARRLFNIDLLEAGVVQ